MSIEVLWRRFWSAYERGDQLAMFTFGMRLRHAYAAQEVHV